MITVQPPLSVPSAPARLGVRNVAEYAESRLRGNSYLALKNICCKYQDGILTLRGCLPSYYLKQVAQTAVAHIEGVRRVVNEIVVTPSPSACRSARN
jgi:osmotically-inducible protein OsmY